MKHPRSAQSRDLPAAILLPDTGGSGVVIKPQLIELLEEGSDLSRPSSTPELVG